MENLHENCYDANKRQLNLSHCNLRSIDPFIVASYAACTEYLDLSHNRITALNWLYEFPHLKCLIMDDNRLREAHFEKLKEPLTNIQTLVLNKNELSDLKTTASMLQRCFPNLEYLSLHGNPMCPDNLLLQPFCEFVPYEYNHYRLTLLKSLPNLKFLDHFSLDTFQLKSQTLTEVSPKQQHQQQQHHQLQHNHRNQQHQQNQQLLSTSKDLWSKLKSFLTANTTNHTTFPSDSQSNFVPHTATSYEHTYKGVNSEGNRFITNSDL